MITLFFPAFAQESNEDQPPDPDTGESTLAERTLGILPNPLRDRGIKFAATYIGEALGNTSGGLRQGGLVQGRLNLAVDVDYANLIGWSGLTGHANLFAIHGDGLSRSNLQNFFVTSGIEALPTVRLYEAYLEQKFLNDRWSIRFGQLAADGEFVTTKYTDVFTNASLGWPALNAINLPSGAPSPPLAAIGARIFGQLNDHVAVLAAVFDGDPAGPGASDPQERNRYGLNFRVADPPLLLSEVQFGWKSFGGIDHLPGTLKVGGWHHFGSFADQRYDANGVSLADPAGSGVARQLRGSDGIHLVVEQRLFSVPDDDTRGVGLFGRILSSPNDRNLIDLYVDCGIDVFGVWGERPHDKFGIAVGHARVSRRAQDLDRDIRRSTGAEWPIRTSEQLLTVSYQYEAMPGWNIVPNVQYIRRPGGGATDPLGPTPGKTLRDATVISLRTVLKF